jgi:hypothetical protein
MSTGRSACRKMPSDTLPSTSRFNVPSPRAADRLWIAALILVVAAGLTIGVAAYTFV